MKVVVELFKLLWAVFVLMARDGAVALRFVGEFLVLFVAVYVIPQLVLLAVFNWAGWID